MSDQSQGPGWWLASDGKWYPPDQAPAVPPPETWAAPPQGPPPSGGMPTGAKVAIAVVGGLIGLIVISILALALLGEEAEKSFDSTGTAIGGLDDDGDDGGDGDGDGGGPADAPGGYTIIEGEGVSIAVPDDWEEMAAEDFDMTAEEFEAAFPDAPPEMLEQASGAFEQGAALMAFRFDLEFSSNVNVASFPGEAPLSTVESQVEQQLETLGGTVHSIDTITVPAGDALRVVYTIEVTGPGSSTVAADGVQYYVPTDGRTYVVTITDLGDVETLADTMIETFRVG